MTKVKSRKIKSHYYEKTNLSVNENKKVVLDHSAKVSRDTKKDGWAYLENYLKLTSSFQKRSKTEYKGLETKVTIPFVLESKVKTTLATIGILSIATIIGAITAYYDEKMKMSCYGKAGYEGFLCRKKIKLKELETKISALRKRLRECFVKIDEPQYFLRQSCVDNTVSKIQELKDKYEEILKEKYKEKTG